MIEKSIQRGRFPVREWLLIEDVIERKPLRGIVRTEKGEPLLRGKPYGLSCRSWKRERFPVGDGS